MKKLMYYLLLFLTVDKYSMLSENVKSDDESGWRDYWPFGFFLFTLSLYLKRTQYRCRKETEEDCKWKKISVYVNISYVIKERPKVEGDGSAAEQGWRNQTATQNNSETSHVGHVTKRISLR